MNPIINQMMSGFMNKTIGMFKTIQNSQNPNALMQSMASSNPQLNQTLEYIKNNGGNAKQLFYNMCQQKGTDPNIIINQIKNQF